MVGQEYWEATILGIVQGIAEFLPISSSGHLVIVGSLLGRPADSGSLELNIALHLGTLFSILVVYRRDVVQMCRQFRTIFNVGLATLPIVVVGLTLKDSIESAFETPLIAGCCLFITAALLLLGQRLERGDRSVETMTWRNALAVGLFQMVAVLPGISRSGSTIAGGMMSGLRRDSAATFSFLIAIPAIGGASVLLIKDLLEAGPGGESVGVMGLGAVVSFLVGWASLRVLIHVVSRRKLHWFAYYCLAVGSLTVVWQLLAR